MLTIKAMVRVGPWTLMQVQRVDKRQPCERCDTPTREVWTCELDRSHNASELGGQRVWHIGSTCGPTLMDVSQQQWNTATKGVRSHLRLVKRVSALLQADGSSQCVPASVLEKCRLLLAGELEARLHKHLGGVITQYERQLGLRS